MRDFPRLPAPPISEVICGFMFEPHDGLDALEFGVYWESRRGEFPKRELHPPLFDGGGVFQVGASAVRAWLISEADDFLIQLQPDRFYVNWRAREADYPRFGDHDGQVGLKTRALAELRRFSDFAHARTGRRLVLKRVELAKIDVFQRGLHWSTLEDLGAILQVARVFEDIQASDPVQLQLRLTEPEGDGATVVSFAVGDKGARLESRVIQPATDDLDAGLDRANRRLNQVFFGLVSRDQLGKFGWEE